MFFEDLTVGTTFETASKTLSEEEIIDFARQWDPQPFHIDREAAAKSNYGGIIASGFHTILVAFNLILTARDWSKSSMGSPGMENIRWIMPVRPGDSLRVRAEVLGQTASKSRPDRGFADIQYDILNQRDELVAAYRSAFMVRKRG